MLLATRTAAHDPGRAIGLSVLAAASLAPVGTLAAELRALQELGPMIDRLLDIAEAPKEQPVALPAFPPLRGEVTLERVDFRYDARSPLALEQISLTVPPGSKLGVVGNSGSGKSTLSLLLAMLYQPSAGRLLLDGLDPYAHDLASLRRQIGVVLQTPFLIAGTIRENIAFGTRGLRDDDIERAAAAACIHDEIMTMPNGYDTVLAEHGAGVSGGQAQRIMLARALARRPAILVLDEATSALDPITEAAVEANLRQLTMTRIVIAHRLSTVIDSDQLVVLDGGRVVEQGRPAELVSAGGYFARLVGADRARTNQS
jgi:ABC-type bacteriocin/lantibiotic exporter with double-glycine peptidase domain